jgi:hypothetical protein
MFGDDYVDEIGIDTTGELPVPIVKNVDCYFETVPFDFSTSENLRSTKAKTTRAFTLNYIAPETTKFEFGYKTIDENEVESEEIYKIVDESFDNNLEEYVYLPYGTKLQFDEDITFSANHNGILGWYYGTQTDEIKSIFGFVVKDGIITLGTFSIDVTDPENYEVEVLKEIYNSTDGYKMTSIILKKKLDLLNLFVSDNTIDITPSGDNSILIVNPTLNEIPQTINIKEKARKIMFLKFYVKSEKYACEFDRIFIDFRMAGKYRGE